jgi:uncharacterized protein with PIN domain
MKEMARLYSNENFPIDIVRQLRQMGHDVLTSYEAGQANQKISDAAVLSFATQDDRIVITLNREDFIQLHRSGIEHRGIIICKDDRDYESQSQFVQNLLAENPDLSDRLLRVKKQNQPGSSSPVFVDQEYAR